ncbi:hypothetical protein SSX86_013816 [Deinandra increscens subsp. villosa]|uniref:CALMODULIN-BINDING PROTEIN60 n=1 Tax=Deinandra increscens subsp. villosa TaxID=3103831 RepID=A0AAP0GX25_9ASTR
MTSLCGQLPEKGTTDDHESELNSCSSDELSAFSNLPTGVGEMMVIRTLRRFIGPIFVPIFRPLVRQLVEEQIGLAKQELLASMKENPLNKTRASSAVLRRLKLKFRNKIALPVLTGIPLLGENHTPIEIALVDALTEQIVNNGTGSTAKLEIMGFRVGDDDDDDSWTFEEFQERIMSERKGRRILQGNTCLQLKDGIGFVHEIHFTHNSEHMKNGFYRLGAVVVDAALMKQVEVAWTETFVLKDKRSTYYEKHAKPFLSDKVYHLQNIRYKGTRYKHLLNAEVETVRDLLILLYTDSKRLENILELKASSKIWGDIVKNAQASNGMFLYLDPGNEGKTGVVLDVKQRLKALIIEPHLYITVNHLSDQQKAKVQDLVKFASENLEMLEPFEDETSLKNYLQSHPGFTSSTSAIIADGPPITSSQVAEVCLNNSNHTPFERAKEKAPFDDEMIYSTNSNQEYIPLHPNNLKGPNWLNFMSATEPGTSSQADEPILDIEGFMNTFDNINDTFKDWDFEHFLSAVLSESPDNECHTHSVCTIARTRWTKVSKLLRRNSIRKRISLSQGIQPLKKQRCC